MSFIDSLPDPGYDTTTLYDLSVPVDSGLQIPDLGAMIGGSYDASIGATQPPTLTTGEIANLQGNSGGILNGITSALSGLFKPSTPTPSGVATAPPTIGLLGMQVQESSLIEYGAIGLGIVLLISLLGKRRR